MTDVHTCALNGDAVGIINHLKRQPNLVSAVAYGRAPLHLAAQRGHYDACKALLVLRADANIKEHNNGETPLHIACTNGHTEVAMLLCDRGARINERDGRYSWTPLHHACERGDTATACALLDREARSVDGHAAIDARDKEGFTPLHHAMINGYPDVAACLIDRGADMHAQAANGWSVMHCACRRGLMSTCIKLILAGVLINTPDKAGLTPLDIAHETRINKDELLATSVAYWRQIRRTEKEKKDIAEGKNLYISPPKKADNKKKVSKVRTSIWGEDFDITKTEDESLEATQAAVAAMRLQKALDKWKA